VELDSQTGPDQTSNATVHCMVFDGFADWEPSFALAELRRSGGLQVTAVGFTASPVTSMGGLRILPDRTLTGIDTEEVRLLLLPGGDLWEGSYPREPLDQLLLSLDRSQVPIAGICGATLALARAGLLDHRAHTSNAPDYLTGLVPEYRGADRYVDALAVRDRHLITANGLGSTEFAREIFEELEVFTPSDRALWYRIFKSGRIPAPST
jgi:putative intracellular protease/amidase